MSILDRAIARQYLTNIVILFVVLFSFVVAVDASINLNRFADRARDAIAKDNAVASPLNTTWVTLTLIADFWWPNLIRLFNYMLGLVLVGAMGFTLTQMVRGRELVAVLASGQSLLRVARPIVIVALLLTGLQLANREFIMPKIAPLLTRDQGDAGLRGLGAARVPLTPDTSSRLWMAEAFDADKGTLTGLTVWERDAEGRTQRRIVAPEAKWDGSAWLLTNAVADRIRGQFAAGQKVDRIETNLDPTTLTVRRSAGFAQNLSFTQLTRMIERPELLDEGTARRLAELDRIRFGRFAVALCNILTLLITLRFYLLREPTNMLMQSVRCAPVAIISLLGAVLGATATLPGVPPAISPFVPAVILLPLAIAAITSIRT